MEPNKSHAYVLEIGLDRAADWMAHAEWTRSQRSSRVAVAYDSAKRVAMLSWKIGSMKHSPASACRASGVVGEASPQRVVIGQQQDVQGGSDASALSGRPARRKRWTPELRTGIPIANHPHPHRHDNTLAGPAAAKCHAPVPSFCSCERRRPFRRLLRGDCMTPRRCRTMWSWRRTGFRGYSRQRRSILRIRSISGTSSKS
ncbi:hypothetical protein BU26DRAFT_155241 [Trematosphaeria pertusa]|uniref:Uncharacterized protein n=1 Tax=Trematosphaeria pertusa TaxID=390896 RepID=A0A6A6IY22_9PLEO|nr:uncharacterized protein BU26DRAFT_155241 [Trematosphaeria pertusa]KAF2255389.1 hypothetical protein BU26DRAFT_155241 [Trematosphaeria pertusa]